MRILSIVFAAILLSGAVRPGRVHAGKAELFGALRDPQGLPIGGAKLVCSETATGAQFDVVSDDRGDYHLLGLAARRVILIVEKSGFRPYRQEGIRLRIGDQTAWT